MKKIFNAIIFFIGWILSPFTWWNDAFINMPLSYLLANILFCVTRLPFKYLVLGSYWVTNLLGIYFMYFGAKHLILRTQDRLKAAVIIAIILIVYSATMIYLDKKGRLIPLETYFKRFCVSIEKDR